MSTLFHVIVCAAIKNSKNQFLLAKRKSEKILGGLWEFPGGKLESNEELIAALQREIREELSLEIANCQLLHLKPFVYGHGQVLILFYVCDLKSGKVKLVDHEEVRWCHLEEIHSLALLPANQELIAALQKHQKNCA